jgi:hypothetical protein
MNFSLRVRGELRKMGGSHLALEVLPNISNTNNPRRTMFEFSKQMSRFCQSHEF